MFVITATFDPELAAMRIRDLLPLADTPDTLAERLGIMPDLEIVRQGVVTGSFKRLLTDVKQRRQYLGLGAQVEEARKGGAMDKFFGSGMREKKIARLEEERKKLNTARETQRWFYKHPRVVLLSAVRDYALDGALHPDAAWREVNPSDLPFPIAAMFDAGDVEAARTLVGELEKPFKQVDVDFLLQKFEGHRSIGFDVKTGLATYYMPAPAEA